MKKIVFFVFIFFLKISCFQDQEILKKNRSEIFIKDCQIYAIEPGWVISDFLKMDLQEFEISWRYLIDIFKNRPWDLCDDTQDTFSEKKRRTLLIEHCRHYALFLDQLSIDMATKKLLLQNNSASLSIVSVYQYWNLKKNNEYIHFYAFYFDRVAAQLVEVVMNAYQDQAAMKDYIKKAHYFIKQLRDIFKHLKEFEYGSRYAYQLKRYQEVIEIMSKELIRGGE